jgi:hypothetical protein
MINRNNINMLLQRFSVAPMMDWTDRPRKAKHGQHLSVVVLNHAGPNAVPPLLGVSMKHAISRSCVYLVAGT